MNTAALATAMAPIAMYSILSLYDKWQGRDVPNDHDDAQLLQDDTLARWLYGARGVDDAEAFCHSCRCSG